MDLILIKSRWLIPIWLFTLHLALAQSPTKVEISQARANLPQVHLYLHVSTGTAPADLGLRTDQLNVTIDAEPAEVTSVQPFTQSGEGVAYIMLVDISKSLSEAQFGKIREALTQWVTGLKEKDRMTLYTFGNEVNAIVDFTNDQAALLAAIATMRPTDQKTQLFAALKEAIDAGTGRLDIPVRRALVVLGDGKDEKPENANRPDQNDILGLIGEKPLPIYSLGYSNLSENRARFLKVLEDFSYESGGKYLEATDDQFTQHYQTIASLIQNVQLAELRCETCPQDGAFHSVDVKLTIENKILNGKGKIYLSSPAPVPDAGNGPGAATVIEPLTTPFWKNPLYWALGALLLLALALVVARLKKRGEPEAASDAKGSSSFAQVPAPTDSKTTTRRDQSPCQLITLTPLNHSSLLKRSYSFPPVVTIGRDNGNSLVVAGDERMSGSHCEIYCEINYVMVRDLQSRNGTLVNGIPIAQPHLLEKGDILLLGNSELRVDWEGGV